VAVLKRRFLLAVLLTLLPFRLTAQEDVPEAARALLEQAQQAQRAGRMDDAIEKYASVIERVPSAISAYVGLGAIYYQRGDAAKAYEVFSRGLAVAPTHGTLLSNAAAAALQANRPAEALGLVDRALALAPSDAELHALRATALRALQRPQEAIGEIQTAIGKEPDQPKHYFTLGNLLYQVDRKDDAVEAFRKAVALDRKYLRAWYNLGAVLFDAGRYDEALKAYQVALEPIDKSFAKGEAVDPIHARAYRNLGAIYVKQKQWQLALGAYGKALRLDPKDAAAYYNTGFIDYTTGDFAQAEEAYRAALKLDPSLPLAYLHLGLIAARRHDDASAIASLETALPSLEADNRREALRTLGAAHLRRGNREAAEAAYVLNDGDVASMTALARIGRAKNDAAMEKRWLQKLDTWQSHARMAALLLADDDAAADQVRHELELALKGNVDPKVRPRLEAARATLAALAGDPSGLQATGGSALAALRIANGDAAGAVALLQPLAAQGDAATRGNLGVALWLAGKNEEAKPYLTAATQAFPHWISPQIALGAIALAEKNYAAAIARLDACRAKTAPPAFSIGNDTELCSRAQQWLGAALVGAAATAREPRPLLDRALSLPLESRTKAVALLLRGTETRSADDLERALAAGLPDRLLPVAKTNLAAAQGKVQ
jgi:tetratricopeptide (TPR) repeat protein